MGKKSNAYIILQNLHNTYHSVDEETFCEIQLLMQCNNIIIYWQKTVIYVLKTDQKC